MVRKRKEANEKPISTTSKEVSGAAKRKKRKEFQDDHLPQLQQNAAKFFNPVNKSTEPSRVSSVNLLGHNTNHFSNSSSSASTTATVEKHTAAIQPDTLDDRQTDEVQNKAFDESQVEINSANSQALLDFSDPSTWPAPLTEEMQRQILTAEKQQDHEDSIYIPVNGHKFSSNYFTGKKANGESYFRDWLLYSRSTNSLFCIPCCLFTQKPGTLSPWANWGKHKIGYQDFNVTLRGIRWHEQSLSHLDSIRYWKTYLKNLKNTSSLLHQTIQAGMHQINHWRNVLRGILDAVLFLSKNNLAFRGASDNIEDQNCGNFLDLIKLLSNYYPPLASHIDQLKKKSVSYLSPQTQNEFIQLCGSSVKQNIIQKIKQRKYFSIQFDSTPDVSRQDQVSQIVRSVECSETGCKIVENFIDFIQSSDKTGEKISMVIADKIKLDGLNIKDCRGQGYDNGANMAGVYSGVQKWIQDLNSTARFIPCVPHSLNRVGVNAAEKVLPAKLVLGIVQNTFLFFSSSTSRWQVLKKHTKTTLKCESQTRWSAKASAVSALWNGFGGVLESLSEISSSQDFSADVCAAATSNLRDLLNYKFVLSLSVWNQILFQINTCSIKVQGKYMDLKKANQMLKVLCEWLKEFQKTGYQRSEELAKSVAEDFDISSSSGFDDVRRGRGINRKYMVTEEYNRQKSQSNLERFKETFFDKLMEQLLHEFKSRFKAVQECIEDFDFLWGPKLTNSTATDQRKSIMDLCLKYPDDFNSSAFDNELQTLAITIRTFAADNRDIGELEPLEILSLLHLNALQSSYPNTEVALRIFLTLPVSVAGNERAFSKLKIIKNYLRSRMAQERLSSLAILSIEREITDVIDFDAIIDKFAKQKCRKVSIN